MPIALAVPRQPGALPQHLGPRDQGHRRQARQDPHHPGNFGVREFIPAFPFCRGAAFFGVRHMHHVCMAVPLFPLECGNLFPLSFLPRSTVCRIPYGHHACMIVIPERPRAVPPLTSLARSRRPSPGQATALCRKLRASGQLCSTRLPVSNQADAVWLGQEDQGPSCSSDCLPAQGSQGLSSTQIAIAASSASAVTLRT